MKKETVKQIAIIAVVAIIAFYIGFAVGKTQRGPNRMGIGPGNGNQVMPSGQIQAPNNEQQPAGNGQTETTTNE